MDLFIIIKDLICAMESYGTVYFNILSGEYINGNILNESELHEYSDILIPIPLINMQTIKKQFIEKVNDLKLKNKFKKISNNNFDSEFHHLTVDHNIEKDWWDFEDTALQQIAIEWCINNNFKYSLK